MVGQLSSCRRGGTAEGAWWQAWPQVRVEQVENGSGETLPVGTRMRVRAHVQLGSLKPDDVAVELYLGRVNAAGDIADAQTTLMKAAGNDPRGRALFEADPVMCARSGQHGFTVRVTPNHPDLVSRFLPGLITWADGVRVDAHRAG